MRVAYLDCFAGISGDMFLGALIDAGVPRNILEEAAGAMQLGASLRFDKVDRSGICAIKVDVLEGDRIVDALPAGELPDALSIPKHSVRPPDTHPPLGMGHSHPHTVITMTEPQPGDPYECGPGRSLTVIRQLIQDSTLDAAVQTLAIRTFELLGHAEAKIHNVSVEEIHFHELGAVDAIVDIIAAAAGIVYLNIDAWYSSAINVGGGTVRCAHGLFPVPAPATADLLRGLPTYSAHVQKELVTPTGAALLRSLNPCFGPQPAMVVDNIGYGAGTRNPANFPNVLRLSVGTVSTDVVSISDPVANAMQSSHRLPPAEMVTVLETALDDMTPQVLAYVVEQALRLGALDVMLTSVTMKKGRPGTIFTVLAKPEDAATFERLLLRETTTLGVRVRQDRRTCLDREHVTVETTYGTIRVKTGSLHGEILNIQPEFEDCRRAAEELNVPLKHVQAAATSAYLNQRQQGSNL